MPREQDAMVQLKSQIHAGQHTALHVKGQRGNPLYYKCLSPDHHVAQCLQNIHPVPINQHYAQSIYPLGQEQFHEEQAPQVN